MTVPWYGRRAVEDAARVLHQHARHDGCRRCRAIPAVEGSPPRRPVHGPDMCCSCLDQAQWTLDAAWPAILEALGIATETR